MFTLFRKYLSPFALQKEELGLLQIFKPLYFFLSMVGLFPSFIEFPSGKRKLIILFKSNAINLACILLMNVIIVVSFALHILVIFSNQTNTFRDVQVTSTNYILNLVLSLLFSEISYIYALKNRSSYIKILNEMAGSWADLPDSRDDILGPLRVQVNCLIFGTLLLMLIVQLAITLTIILPKYTIALIALTFNLPNMLQFTVLAFYFVLIVMIVALLKNIEEHFAMIVPMRRERGMENLHVRFNLGSSLASLRQLRGVYARALAIKRQVNALFQAPLLLILAQSFHSLVSFAHIIYHGVTFQYNFSRHELIESCFWVCYQLIKFHILGFSSALFKLQVNKIGRALYNISPHINKKNTRCKSWADINDEISLHLEVQHFASLMKFQDTEITIYGLFPLKPSLLFNVVASAVMYLVILMQFDDGK